MTFGLAILPLWGWWMTGLFDLDEGFYGAVTREMLARGDWIIPHYNGLPWFEKPILFYWVAAPFVWLFGEDYGPRMPSVLAAVGLYALVGRVVARRIHPAAGRWTVLVLATSPLLAAVGRLMLVDVLFALVLSAAFFAYFASLSETKWRFLAGLFLGLAVLTKGPVALLLLGGTAIATAWKMPQRRGAILAWRPNAIALACFVGVVAIWYLPAYLQGGRAFVEDFLVRQNLGRFAGGDLAHRVPWYLYVPYYFLVLGFGMLPWSYRAYEGLPRRAEFSEREGEFVWFCGLWAAVVVLFFTISGSKLPHYVIPAFVPLAILAGRTFKTRFFGPGAVAWALFLGVGLNLLFSFAYQKGAGLVGAGQARAHDLIRQARGLGGDVVAYQLSRRQADRGTGRLNIQETSLPSLTFYLGKPLRDVETFGTLAGLPTPTLIFTRTGRIAAGDVARLASRGLQLELAAPQLREDRYVLYRLIRRTDSL